MKQILLLFLWLIPMLALTQNEAIEAPVKSKGYYNYTSIGSLIGSKNDLKTYITSIIMEHNYQFNKHFSTGIVTGVEWFDVTVMPIGPNVKVLFPGEKQSSFYWGASGGYAIALEDMDFGNYEIIDTKGGTFFNSEIGYVFPTKQHFNLFIAIGYRYHEFAFVRSDWRLNEVERKTSYNRFSIRLGVRVF
ncbi:hypothetical protein [Carboxylicivirga marina]|uniref:Outer membrane protein beta-barrel domain-containing protein n=1 Tax=Carboxylicivirga marina TaxID=2800988 RepID=A0ABS1HFF1_9BACT|nr:hypothetical protein [Carboxylicivirga marina]MBK3516331.1 hypothetical protein [Carboxylicivirga marina]